MKNQCNISKIGSAVVGQAAGGTACLAIHGKILITPPTLGGH